MQKRNGENPPININNKTERGPDHFPFLGVKSSGIGVQGIKYSIEAMTRRKGSIINFKKQGILPYFLNI